jgi:diguanylate cyclase (GGDEF)-like protein
LWIGGSADAAALASELVTDLGGLIVRARDGGNAAVPLDVSFGVGEPVLPLAPPTSVARMLLERHLPVFVRDAQRAIELIDHSVRAAEDAAVDSLTGLSSRRMLGRALGRINPENTIIMIDLDHFKMINDTFGHAQGDAVLSALGGTLAATVRASDRVGRYGGEEFVVILADGDAEAFLNRLRAEWTRNRPRDVTFSAGVAPAQPGMTHALEAADRAMYRAKESGRDQWQWATAEDYA